MHVSSPSSDHSSSSTPPTSSGPAVQDELVSSTTTTSTYVETSTATDAQHQQPTKISFSVTRRETTRVVVGAKNKLSGVKPEHEDDEEEEEEQQRAKKRGILSLEDGIVVDSEADRSKPKKKVFIIPVLRLSTQSQIERLKKLVEDGTATESDRARLSLLLESVESDQQEKIDLSGSDLQTGPTVVVADDADPDYESMPVGEFGLAFLRGCGWRDAQSSIGKSNARAVPLRVTAPRPKGLGLGAVLPAAAPPSVTNSTNNSQQKGDGEERLGKNSYVKCLSGLNKGAYGQVSSMDEENASVFVELAWPPESVGKTVRINQMAVEVVPRKDFKDRLKAAARGADNPEVENGRRRVERIRV